MSILISFYIVWSFLHGFLLVYTRGKGYREHFWPFTDERLYYTYDYSEFFVYVGAPVVLFLLIVLNTPQRHLAESSADNVDLDNSFEEAIVVEETVQEVKEPSEVPPYIHEEGHEIQEIPGNRIVVVSVVLIAALVSLYFLLKGFDF